MDDNHSQAIILALAEAGVEPQDEFLAGVVIRRLLTRAGFRKVKDLEVGGEEVEIYTNPDHTLDLVVGDDMIQAVNPKERGLVVVAFKRGVSWITSFLDWLRRIQPTLRGFTRQDMDLISNLAGEVGFIARPALVNTTLRGNLGVFFGPTVGY